MARPLVLGNGQLLICMDERLVMRDLYYPRVGQVNQIAGLHNQIGCWVERQFAWVSHGEWNRQIGYVPGSMVTDCTAEHPRLGLKLSFRESLHPREPIFLRRIRVQNQLERAREVRIFACADFDLDENNVGDTAMWDPQAGAMIHYKRQTWILLGANSPDGGIEAYATGRKRFGGAEGTWRDAEDGILEGEPISQGSVDSTIGLTISLSAGGSADLYFWLVCGRSGEACRDGDRLVRTARPDQLLQEAEQYWLTWADDGRSEIHSLPTDLQEAYRRSLLITRTQMDNGGAILAATDSDILERNRDHYSYMWPRDGAFIAAALDRAGHAGLTRSFFRFCQEAISAEGFLWHKYNPDGSVGSSWHPLLGVKGEQLPIQEDETALVLWALGRHFERGRELEFIASLYDGLIRPAADFLVRFRDVQSSLPLESYDLWEERRGVFTFTAAAVTAGLAAAGAMALALGDGPRAERYTKAAEETRQAVLIHLWSEAENSFLRGFYRRKDGTQVLDPTLDSSLMAIFLLDLLPPTDARVKATMQMLAQGLWVGTPVGGLARYTGDYYFRVTDEVETVPGNPWIICTLWLARYQIITAGNRAELEPAMKLIRWALRHALPTGVLPEQVHPLTGAPLSVAPLTWSHAVMVDLLLDLAEWECRQSASPVSVPVPLY